jgi:hypothetical protein
VLQPPDLRAKMAAVVAGMSVIYGGDSTARVPLR